MMNITHDNIVNLILDPESRYDLFKAISLENNNSLNIRNAIADAIYNLKAIDESQMVQIQNILLPEGIRGEKILSDFVSNKYFPKRLLYELLDENKCISALCHKREPIYLLLKLIKKYDNCSEAIITIGKHYYLSPEVSSSKFADYVEKYKEKDGLLSSLIHILELENPKTEIFTSILKTGNQKYELIKLCFDLLKAKELTISEDIEFITKMAATNNPRFLRAISCNHHTPKDILMRLSVSKNIKYAKEIRHNSISNIRKNFE